MKEGARMARRKRKPAWPQVTRQQAKQFADMFRALRRHFSPKRGKGKAKAGPAT
jgi:hypothetical protein